MVRRPPGKTKAGSFVLEVVHAGGKVLEGVYLPMKARRTVPIGPLRCLPMMISATP